jgi:hypothetical protein
MENLYNPFYPFINVLVSILIFIHLIYCSINYNFLKKKLCLITFAINYCLIIICITVITFLISIFYINKEIIKIIYLIFFLISIHNFKKKNFSFLKKKTYLKNHYLFLVVSSIFLLLSLIPASDADSLDYHLGAAINILKYKKFVPNFEWFHYQLIGYGEYFNVFFLGLQATNLGQINNFFSIILIFLILYSFEKNKNTGNHYYSFFIFGAPVFIWLISSSKPMLFPSLLIFICLYLIYENKNLYKYTFLILLFISFAILTKLSFIFSSALIFIIVLLNSIKFNKINNFIKYGTINFILIIFPFVLNNYLNYHDPFPPFFEKLKQFPNEDLIYFIESIKTDRATHNYTELSYSILYPLFLSLPTNISILTTVLGPIYFIGFFYCLYIFIKNKIYFKIFNHKNIFFIIIFFEYLILINLPNHQPRYFLISYYSIIMLLIINSKNNFFFKFTKFIGLSAVLFVLIGVAISVIMYLPSILTENKIINYYKKVANNYQEILWIEKNIKQFENNDDISKKKIVSETLRSYALLNVEFMSRQGFFNKSTHKKIKIVKNNKIDYIIFSYPLTLNNQEFIKKCENKNFGRRINEFQIGKRNPFYTKDYSNYKILMIKNLCKDA